MRATEHLSDLRLIDPNRFLLLIATGMTLVVRRRFLLQDRMVKHCFVGGE
jgi:hypothetical protein